MTFNTDKKTPGNHFLIGVLLTIVKKSLKKVPKIVGFARSKISPGNTLLIGRMCVALRDFCVPASPLSIANPVPLVRIAANHCFEFLHEEFHVSDHIFHQVTRLKQLNFWFHVQHLSTIFTPDNEHGQNGCTAPYCQRYRPSGCNAWMAEEGNLNSVALGCIC